MDDIAKESSFSNRDARDSQRAKRLPWPAPPPEDATPRSAAEQNVRDAIARAQERRSQRKGAAGKVLKTQLRSLLDDFSRTREEISQKFREAEANSPIKDVLPQPPIFKSSSQCQGYAANDHVESTSGTKEPDSPDEVAPRRLMWRQPEGPQAAATATATTDAVQPLAELAWGGVQQQSKAAPGDSPGRQALKKLSDLMLESRGVESIFNLNSFSLEPTSNQGTRLSFGTQASSLASTMDEASAPSSVPGLHSGAHTPRSQGGSSAQFSTGIEAPMEAEVEGPLVILPAAERLSQSQRWLSSTPTQARQVWSAVASAGVLPEDPRGSSPLSKALHAAREASPIRTRKSSTNLQAFAQTEHDFPDAAQEIADRSEMDLRSHSQGYCRSTNAALPCSPPSAASQPESRSPQRSPQRCRPSAAQSFFAQGAALACSSTEASSSSLATFARLAFSPAARSGSAVAASPLAQEGASTPSRGASALQWEVSPTGGFSFGSSAGSRPPRRCQLFPAGPCTPSRSRSLTPPPSQDTTSISESRATATADPEAIQHLQQAASQPRRTSALLSKALDHCGLSSQPQPAPEVSSMPTNQAEIDLATYRTAAQQEVASARQVRNQLEAETSELEALNCFSLSAAATSQPPQVLNHNSLLDTEEGLSSQASPQLSQSKGPSQALVDFAQQALQELHELRFLREESSLDADDVYFEPIIYSGLCHDEPRMGPTQIPGVGLVEGAKSVARLLLPRLASSVAWQVDPRWQTIDTDADSAPAAPASANPDAVAPGSIRRAPLGVSNELPHTFSDE